MPKEMLSMSAVYLYHKGGGICFGFPNEGKKNVMLPKSQIEVDGVSHVEDYENLITGEEVDIYIPEWLANDKGLL